MITQNELITTIIDDYANGYSRPKIRGYLQRIINMMFANDCAMTTFLNRSDDYFPIPFLSTTAGQLSYDLSTATLLDSDGAAVSLTLNGYAITPRRVKEIFTRSSITMSPDNNRLFYGEEFAWSGLSADWSRSLYRVEFYRIPHISFDATGHEGVRIQFVEDPGTTTEKYYVEFYFEPPELTAETIPLPLNTNEWAPALIDGVVGIIEDLDGKSDRLVKFETYWMKKFLRKYNHGIESRRPIQIQMRECG